MPERPFPRTEATELRFEWDAKKSSSNAAKHGFTFENASRAFAGSMLRRIDDRRDYGEERWIGLGRIEDVVVAIAYTVRSDKVRIISARKANRNETKTYEQAVGEEGPGR